MTLWATYLLFKVYSLFANTLNVKSCSKDHPRPTSLFSLFTYSTNLLLHCIHAYFYRNNCAIILFHRNLLSLQKKIWRIFRLCLLRETESQRRVSEKESRQNCMHENVDNAGLIIPIKLIPTREGWKKREKFHEKTAHYPHRNPQILLPSSRLNNRQLFRP